MQKILKILAFSAMLSPFALAETWSGELLDASCYDQKKAAETCAATSTTTTFALTTSGKVYKFDSVGNSKASAALSHRADRSVPGQPSAMSRQIMASVQGTESSGTIKVDSIDVQ